MRFCLRLNTFFTLLLLVTIVFARTSYACPKIKNLIDFNCDEQFKVAIAGDSIVRGVRDTDPDYVGYPGRLEHRYAKVNGIVANLGVPGISSELLLRSFKKLLNENPAGETTLKSSDADMYLIAVGVNDYWNHQEPALTVRNIARIVDYLKRKLRRLDGTTPLFAVATLTPTKRAFQQPFIDDVNSILLSQKSSRLPVYLRFENLDKSLLSYDGLHPSASGYDKLASITAKYIEKVGQTRSKLLRHDRDHDGVYDELEKVKFLTNTRAADTDSDALSDGDEIFKYRTNPLAYSSDGSGVSDYEHVFHVTPTPGP